MKINVDEIPPAPTEPTYMSCDGGYCDEESVGWRFYPFPAPGQWLPVCSAHLHVKGVPGWFRRSNTELIGGEAMEDD